MKIEGALSCSKQPASGPCPELDRLVHDFPPYLPKIHSNIILPSTARSSKLFFPSDFQDKIPYVFLIPMRSMRSAVSPCNDGL